MSLLASKGLRFLNLAGNLTKLGGYPVRYRITNLEEFGVEWIKPQYIPSISKKKSGDGGLDLGIKSSSIPEIYSNSPEFKDLDDKLKPFFSVAFLSRHDLVKYRMEKTKDLVRRHEFDTNSYEVQIAAMTATILQLQECIEESPHRCGSAKKFLKELIERRQKYFKRLRKWDYRRFEWLLEKLNLVYRPPPTDRTPAFRKESIRRLVKKRCDSIVEEKFAAYKAELNNQKKQFYKEKADKLDFIRKEQIICGVTPSVTEEEIAEVRKMGEQLEK